MAAPRARLLVCVALWSTCAGAPAGCSTGEDHPSTPRVWSPAPPSRDAQTDRSETDASADDASALDASATDIGAADDASADDTSAMDAGAAADASVADAGVTDSRVVADADMRADVAERSDSGSTDAGGADSGGLDAAATDSGSACSCPDDGVRCTVESCDTGTCAHRTDDTRCATGQTCTPTGCAGGMCVMASDCNDRDPCTSDACSAGACSNFTMTCLPDPASECMAPTCDPSSGACVAHPVADGTSCSGGMCCGGACVNGSSDPLHCGSCGRMCGGNAACTAGACHCVGGFEDCDSVPGCEVNTQADAMHCGDCTTACPMGTSCLAGHCGNCTTSDDCPDDGLACTAAARCTARMCTITGLAPGFCLIAGACVAEATPSPSNPCLTCNPGVSPSGWSPAVGQACTDDGLSCTTDRCDATGTCVHTFAGSGCLIGGRCYTFHAMDPTNPCRWCNPSTSATSFSPNPSGSCSDSDPCTSADACGADGLCHGTPVDCADAYACTTDSCNAMTGMCGHVVQVGYCLIGGSACVAQGTRNPDNPCQLCDHAVSTQGWAPTVDNEPCATALVPAEGICCGGTCAWSRSPQHCGTCALSCSSPLPLCCPSGAACCTGVGCAGC